MKLIPPLRTVAWLDAEPGELVRMRRNARSETLGIIALRGKQKNLVCLRTEPPPPQPLPIPGYYTIPPATTVLVLSYGKDYTFHTTPTARMLTSSEMEFVSPGVLLISHDGRASIRIPPQYRHVQSFSDDCFYDIGTGNLLDNDNPTAKRLALLDWEIRLNSEPAGAPPLFTFKALWSPASQATRDGLAPGSTGLGMVTLAELPPI